MYFFFIELEINEGTWGLKVQIYMVWFPVRLKLLMLYDHLLACRGGWG